MTVGVLTLTYGAKHLTGAR